MFRRILFWWRRKQEEQDLDDEIQSHLAIEESESAGDTSERAAAARRAFGNLTRLREETRESWGWAPLERFLEDVRFGGRMLRRTPVWTFVMGVSLALGIGITTAVFSVAYSVLLQPLPYKDPQQLVTLWSKSLDPGGIQRFNAIAAYWVDWRSQAKLFEDIALIRPVANFNLTGDGQPERLQGARTSWNLPAVLGVNPQLGRVFTEEETQRGARVAILSYAFWQGHFAGDPAVVGKQIQLNGEAFDVIGVMPREYQYPTRDFQLWTPLSISPQELRERSEGNYNSIGRLKPGVTVQQAQTEISAIMQHLVERYPQQKLDAIVEPLMETTVGSVRQNLSTLAGSVVCLLLIGCLNLSVLLIGRASARSREMGVRAAIGASPGRLKRQVLAETLPLAIAGTAGGVLTAGGLIRLLLPWLPPNMPRIETIGLHWPALIVSISVSLLVVVAATLLPARLASQANISESMQKSSRTVVTRDGIRDTLVAGQIAVALVLLFGGGLLLRSLSRLLQIHPGFSTESVLTMHLAVTRQRGLSDDQSDAQIADFYERVVERIKTVNGVKAAGFVNRLPLSGVNQTNPIQVEGKPDIDFITTDTRSITSGYFDAIGIPLLRGRTFTDLDSEHASLVAIVDEQLARRVVSGDENPLGKRVRIGKGNTALTPWIEIVGVAGHVRNNTPEQDSFPQVYFPERQRAQDRAALVVRTTGDPAAMTSAVIQQIHSEAPQQPVYDVRTMRDWWERSLQSRELLTGLVSLFGAAALALACIGLYGVVAYTAGLRLREFGIRMALGATAGQVRSLVLGHAGSLALKGCAAGLALAWLAGRAIQGLLFGITSTDMMTFLLAPIVLGLFVLIASLGPAWKSARVDAAETLRRE
jgi:putative ABC transport system permease protein